MAGIIGSTQWQLAHSNIDIREELISWLRFSLMVSPEMQLVAKRDAKNFDIADVVLSRCEVALAFQRLPKRIRWAIWDVVVKRRDLGEVGLYMGLHPKRVTEYVSRGLALMETQIYETLGHVQEHHNVRLGDITARNLLTACSRSDIIGIIKN